MEIEGQKGTTEFYRVSTPLYEGPLDLLLQLIERAELNITNLALAQVTDQYLGYLRNLPDREAGEVSEFLVIAAKLLQIKSEVLLPRPPTLDISEEEPGEALARQLRVYKRFKEIAQLLGAKEAAGLHTYLRLASTPEVKHRVEIGDYTLSDVVNAAREVLLRIDDRLEINTVVKAPKITIREKINQISQFLQKFRRSTFKLLLTNNPSQGDVVVTFLAMLELIKRHLIIARQSSLFGEIEIEASDSWDEEVDFDIEFGE